MELRTGIEIEAAGLAAERATKPQLATIREAYEAIEQAIASGEGGIDQDFAFHCSIAAATGNPQFVSFLEYLGRFIIPRQTIRSADRPAERRAYLRKIQDEHREILDALRSGQTAGARAAMQRHMLNSRKRYRGLAELEASSPVKTVLITGAAGDVGRRLAPLLAGSYRLRLSDLKEPAGMAPGTEFVKADLADLGQVEAAVAGVDGIVHLGGYSIEGPWETILSANIVGCYNLFEAAHRHGVERVVFASSNHAVGFYPRSHKIGTDVTLRPDTRYGVSKAFGEAVGAPLCLQARDAGDVPAHRQCRGRAGRPPPPVDLAQPGRPCAARSHRPRTPGHQVRGILWGIGQRAPLGGTIRTPAASAIGRAVAARLTATLRSPQTPAVRPTQ